MPKMGCVFLNASHFIINKTLKYTCTLALLLLCLLTLKIKLKTMKLSTYVITLLLLTTTIFAQKEVLFTVNKVPVTTKEFLNVYKKNINLIQDETQKDINEYLKLYVNYKLKLEEAKKLKLDKNPKYIKELRSYRNQLAQKYLTDTEINEQLIEQAYNRMVYEVNVNHILVRCSENATPVDTLKAYQRIVAYKKQAQKQGFEKTMKAVHDGNAVYGESLGYFNAFKMVYSFENVAYSTAVNEISKPFRTQFGYHILKVLGKRKSRGEVEVAHIMVATKNKNLTGTPKQKIEEIYKQLKEGANFKDLAKQFSDDIGSAKKGGVLQRFGAGKLSDKNFENTAFSLREVGELSSPIQSKYGWHIIKLIKKYPLQKIAKLHKVLSQKVKRDSRSKTVNDKFYGQLKTRYNYKKNANAMPTLLKVVDQSFLGGRTSEAEKNKEILFSFANKTHSYAEYYQYLRAKIRGFKNLTQVDKIVEDSFDDFVNTKIFTYHDENLENEYEDFAAIVREYREGLLLFELMEKKVWQKAKKDTVGLKSFYENNKQNYIWNTRINAVIVTSTSKKTAKQVQKLLKAQKEIKNVLKNVVVSEGVFEKTDKELPKKLKLSKGISKVYKHNNQYVVVYIKEIIASSQKKLSEIKGKVINDYQEQIEKDWVKRLKLEYPVQINKNAFKKIKEKL